jgi:nucleotidyltransferase AbiEii toxin of type IV toxin-antitoxin system
MQALEFWKTITVDRANLLESLIALLNEHGVKYCVIGGQGVNAYAEPVVSLDLDLAIAAEHMAEAERLLADRFTIKRFPHSLNVSLAGSNLRIQIQTDPRYSEFVSKSATREVLGVQLPVARVEDVLQGKVWAAVDPEGRASKRQKDLADIARLLENYQHLRDQVPAEVLARLV